MALDDTFCALATPVGESAIALVRVSGGLCARLACAALGAPSPAPARRATFGKYRALSGETLDEVVWTFFEKNASYTGDPMLEISLHGNPRIVQRLLDDLRARGCRLAEPGEFTRTAFLNGKMDLCRAEAVCDVIRARSDRALAAAQRQLSGALGKRINALTDSLLSIIAEVEARIDFADEDLPEGDGDIPARALADFADALRRLVETRPYHTLLQEGANAVIVGAPNAGKSTLLNALVGEARALVSPEAGTTRDYIDARARAGDYNVRFVDTAGLRGGALGVEAEGIARSLAQMKTADVYLWVLDISAHLPALPNDVREALAPQKTLVVENKIDLPKALDDNALNGFPHRVRCSLKTGEGVEKIMPALVRLLESGITLPADDAVLVNARQADALKRALAAVETARAQHAQKAPCECVASDLREALDALGEIVGKVDNERVLDRVFSQFCIGK